MTYQIVFITVPNKTVAETIAKGLLNAKLAACVNIVSGVESVYWWKEKIETANELLLIVKTRADLTADITRFVKKNHPYAVPEVIAVKITGGNEDYLNWLGANCTFIRRVKGMHDPA